MPEQPPSFVVVDKRKFTAEGEMRPEAQAEARAEALANARAAAQARADSEVQGGPAQPAASPAPSADTPAPAATAPAAPVSAEPAARKVVTMPTREPAPANDLAEESMAGTLSPMPAPPAFDASGHGPETELDLPQDELDEFIEPQTPEDTAAQDSAYRETTRNLDAMLKQANPGMETPAAASFEHLVQSFYLSAIMAMGAGTEPGQKPRVDIMGARQAIDLLNVLEEKTRGNLIPDEQQLLQTITFELRMAFLELTNAISRQAHQGPAMPPGGKR